MLKDRNVGQVVKTIDKKLFYLICVMFLISCVLLSCSCVEGGSAQQTEKLQAEPSELLNDENNKEIYEKGSMISSDNTVMDTHVIASGEFPLHIYSSFTNGVPRLNQADELKFVVCFLACNVKNASVTFVIPVGIQLVSGNLRWSGDFGKKENKEFKIVVRPVRAGDYTIGVELSYPDQPDCGYGAVSTTYSMNILLTENSSKCEFTYGPPSWREPPKTKGLLTPVNPNGARGYKLTPEEQAIFDKNYKESLKKIGTAALLPDGTIRGAPNTGDNQTSKTNIADNATN
ncbi:MAG: hypothetical protein PHO26_00115 [Dehalococcoidia bacterium]|nr:hypothetical protein [Dehalococcoidia bacterium]MDD5493826.1 hypothetical protein [Dehalococcoidia bacterium]